MSIRLVKIGSLCILFIALLVGSTLQVYSQLDSSSSSSSPIIVDDASLMIEKYVEGMQFPTSMVFLGPDDILVLEKNTGQVRRILNGSILEEPVLDVAVATKDERGLLGIAIAESVVHTYVFLYFTEASGEDSEDLWGVEPLGNRLYRYEFVDGKLINGTLLLDLPAVSSYHHGGRIKIGPDNNVYLTVGDQQEPTQVGEPLTHLTRTQNVHRGLFPDGTAGILRLTQNGEPVQNILGGPHPVGLYYAYGIRNSLGIDFDPVTGNLWNTEIGPGRNDEVNLVEPGFNSGWRRIQGMANSNAEISDLVEYPGLSAGRYSIIGLIEELSLRIQGFSGKYSDPKFVWRDPIIPTAIEFLNSKKLGGKYQNDIFIGSYNYGRIIHFHLNEERNGLYLRGPLEDKIENNPQGYDPVVFGRNFGRVIDLETGPDGYLYILALTGNEGKIYRIIPKDPH
jgi:aldose sugar dehydrogenase